MDYQNNKSTPQGFSYEPQQNPQIQGFDLNKTNPQSVENMGQNKQNYQNPPSQTPVGFTPAPNMPQQTPVYQSAAQPNGYQYNNTGHYNAPEQKNPTLMHDVILSVLVLIFCNKITGIVALVFTLLGDEAWKKADYVKYEEHRKISRIVRIIGLVLFVVGLLIGFMYIIMVLALSSTPT